MITSVNDEKPCLVPAGRGFSVFYRQKYLYSKYEPARTVLRTISGLTLLPGTLILCYSPCLWYGLKELLSRLPTNSFILACEADPKLYELAKMKRHDDNQGLKSVSLLTLQEIRTIPTLLQKQSVVLSDGTKLPPPGTFRRVLRIDFSAGVQFYSDFYGKITDSCEASLAQFWKNRITLMHLGRHFSRNLFRNLAKLPYSIPLQTGSIERPILIFGAGESLEDFIDSDFFKHKQKFFFIIAVDAALPVLLAHSITPDAVIGVECQSVICNSYIGASACKSLQLLDMTTYPDIPGLTGGSVSFFASEYDDTTFFKRLSTEGILPIRIPPLGSVGLTAVQIAIKLRASSSIPIAVAGLDFSYTIGITHVRGAPAHIARLITTSRLTPVGNFGAAFDRGAKSSEGKDGSPVITTISLSGYAENFIESFSNEPNIFDAGKKGLSLGIQKITAEELSEFADKTCTKNKTYGSSEARGRTDSLPTADKILTFYEEEETALHRIQSILSYGQNLSETDRNAQLYDLLSDREYLYLHFPDGYKLTIDAGFLKRIKAEINFFLKDIAIGKTLLSEGKKTAR